MRVLFRDFISQEPLKHAEMDAVPPRDHEVVVEWGRIHRAVRQIWLVPLLPGLPDSYTGVDVIVDVTFVVESEP